MGYRGKVVEQERARELRAEAWTLQEIASELGVSRSSVSLWVRDVEFEPKPRQWSSSAARHRGANVLQRRKAAEIAELIEDGRRRIGALSEREFLVTGAALYAAEGAKRDGVVKFANSDPRMIRVFCSWLRHFFEVDESRLRVALYLHQGLDLDAAIQHWSKLTGVPVEQFTKPYRAVPDPSIRRSKHPMGCPSIAYACTRTHRAVMGLVHALLESSLVLPG
jgi:transcriptional regulator with XRE-family HTH domain